MKYLVTLLVCIAAFISNAQICIDTLKFTFNKAGVNLPVTYDITPTSDFIAYGQYYDCPQPITVSGFCFYSYIPGVTTDSLEVKAKLYDINPLDSMPLGEALVEATVWVDTTATPTDINSIRYCVQFAQPQTMVNGYVVALEPMGPYTLKVLGSNSPDGGGDNLSCARYIWPWIKMKNFAVDFDFHFEPLVSYELNPSVFLSEDTACAPASFFVAGACPGVIFSRMYSKQAFFGNPLDAFAWQIGFAGFASVLDTFVVYTTDTIAEVNFTSINLGWTTNCFKIITDTLNVYSSPVADFGMNGLGLPVEFIGASAGDIAQWTWDFGDGNTGTGQQITHTFGQAGSYTVTLIIENLCGTDTISANVTVPFVGVDEQLANTIPLNLYPNPTNGLVTINLPLGIDNSNQLIVTDIQGRPVLAEANIGSSKQLNTSNLPAGIYVVRYQSPSGNAAKRLVVLR